MDHRSYEARGIDREPQARIPQKILYAERRLGESTPAGDAIRARHRERVEARSQGSEVLARVVERQRAEGKRGAIQSAAKKGARRIPNGALSREQLNEKRRAYCKANSAEINRKQRERRRANAEEVNRKQREYGKKQSAERKAAKLAMGIEKGRPEVSPRAAVHSPAAAAATLNQTSPTAVNEAPPSVSAEESVKNWLAFRAGEKASRVEESLEAWRAYRDSEAQTLGQARDGAARSAGGAGWGVVHTVQGGGDRCAAVVDFGMDEDRHFRGHESG